MTKVWLTVARGKLHTFRVTLLRTPRLQTWQCSVINASRTSSMLKAACRPKNNSSEHLFQGIGASGPSGRLASTRVLRFQSLMMKTAPLDAELQPKREWRRQMCGVQPTVCSLWMTFGTLSISFILRLKYIKFNRFSLSFTHLIISSRLVEHTLKMMQIWPRYWHIFGT